jgi:hypothetical protein
VEGAAHLAAERERQESRRGFGGVEGGKRLEGEEARTLGAELGEGFVLASPPGVDLWIRKRGGLPLDLQRHCPEPRAPPEDLGERALSEDGDGRPALTRADLAALRVVRELDASGTGGKRTR